MMKQKEPSCYHYPKFIYNLGADIFAGQKSACVGYYTNFDLLINCTGNKLIFPQHEIPFEWGKLYQEINITQIYLDWYNGKPLCIDPEFWRDLLKHLLDKKLKTLVMCEGGHGRTGTALTALLIANGMALSNAVDKIRKLHCHRAVETESQMDYLYELEKYFKAGK